MSDAPALDVLLGELRADAGRRAELSRLLLGDVPDLRGALTELASQVTALTTAQQRTEERLTEQLAALAAAQQRTEERLDRLTEQVTALAAAQQRTEERLDRLTERMERLADGMTALAARTGALSERVDSFRGWSVERKYVDKGTAFFQRIARRLRVLQPVHLDRILDPLMAAGTLTEDETEEIRVADAVFSGRLRPSGIDGYLVVEVSVLVDSEDVERAATRAALLRRTGQPVLAVVAGEGVTERAAGMAQRRGVWQVTNGTVEPPPEAGRPRDLVGT